eukprot:6692144-Pyramimonas_sp.AAC.1
MSGANCRPLRLLRAPRTLPGHILLTGCLRQISRHPIPGLFCVVIVQGKTADPGVIVHWTFPPESNT